MPEAILVTLEAFLSFVAFMACELNSPEILFPDPGEPFGLPLFQKSGTNCLLVLCNILEATVLNPNLVQ